MSNKRILHDNGAGGLAIIIPAPKYVQEMLKLNPNMTEAQVIDYIAQKDAPGKQCEVVDVADIPTDRTFRDAWEHDTTPAPEKVRTNMGKAKAIAHDFRRAKRNADFAPLDVQATIPAQAAAAETARQAIRDADAIKQAAIDAATTEAELKSLVV